LLCFINIPEVLNSPISINRFCLLICFLSWVRWWLLITFLAFLLWATHLIVTWILIFTLCIICLLWQDIVSIIDWIQFWCDPYLASTFFLCFAWLSNIWKELVISRGWWWLPIWELSSLIWFTNNFHWLDTCTWAILTSTLWSSPSSIGVLIRSYIRYLFTTCSTKHVVIIQLMSTIAFTQQTWQYFTCSYRNWLLKLDCLILRPQHTIAWWPTTIDPPIIKLRRWLCSLLCCC
jgi:hypothetical protein